MQEMSEETDGVELMSNVDCTDCEMVVINTTEMENIACSSSSNVMILEKFFQCEQCDKTFTQASNLKRHERTHSGERPFSCPTCSRCFAQGNNLKAHMRLHTGERPFTCALCDKSFAQSSNMYKHMRSHSAELGGATEQRRFGCADCGKWFLDSNMLKAHLRTHTGERPYACDVCDRTFTQDSNLRRHRRIHTGERPYKCPVCARAFSQSNNVKAHMAIHDCVDVVMTSMVVKSVSAFECDDCGLTFKNATKLNRHRMACHVDEPVYRLPRIVVVDKQGRRMRAKIANL